MISDSVTILPHSSHADIIFEYKSKLYKCQVKTASKKERVISKHTGKSYRTNWRFDFRRGSFTKNRAYLKGQVDIYACCIMPLNKVVFLSSSYPAQSIRFSDKQIEEIDSVKSLDSALEKVHL